MRELDSSVYLFGLRMGGETAKCSTVGIFSEMKAVWDLYPSHPKCMRRGGYDGTRLGSDDDISGDFLSLSHDISQNSQSTHIP